MIIYSKDFQTLQRRKWALCFSAHQKRYNLVPSSIICSGLHFWRHRFNILSKFGQQQLVMVNYACGLNQSETVRYFEWITLSSTIFHASSIGFRYSLVCTCFSFFISIELVTKRNCYICLSILLIFQMTIDLEILVNVYFQARSISRWTAVIHQFWPRRVMLKLFRFLQKIQGSSFS